MQPVLMILLVGAGVSLLVLILLYNGFIAKRNRIRNAFASVDVQLKKRWDLVPQLVETVRGYAAHEQAVFERITQARRGIQAVASESRARFDYEQDLGAGVSRVMALAENYPELKAGGQFLNLQRNLSEVEAQIAASRRAFNAAVTEWNTSIEMFPGNVFASVFNFKRHDWFETPESQRKVTDVRI